MQSGAQMISGLMDAVTANLPSVINGGVQIINSLVQGVGANIGTLLPSAINLVSTFARGIVSALPQLLLTGMKFLQSLSEGVLNNIDLIVRSASGIVQSFVGSVMSNLPSIITAGLQILTNLAQGAVQAMPRLLVVGLNAINNIDYRNRRTAPENFADGCPTDPDANTRCCPEPSKYFDSGYTGHYYIRTGDRSEPSIDHLFRDPDSRIAHWRSDPDVAFYRERRLGTYKIIGFWDH